MRLCFLTLMLTVFMAALPSCTAETVRLYKGPKRPMSEIAVIIPADPLEHLYSMDDPDFDPEGDLLSVRPEVEIRQVDGRHVSAMDSDCASCLSVGGTSSLFSQDAPIEVHIPPGRHTVEVGLPYYAVTPSWSVGMASGNWVTLCQRPKTLELDAKPGHVYQLVTGPTTDLRHGGTRALQNSVEFRTWRPSIRDVTETERGMEVVASTGQRYSAFWFTMSALDCAVGFPSYFNLRAGRVALGLPPPFGVGVGTSVVERYGALSPGWKRLTVMTPLNIYYLPYVDWEKDGSPNLIVYSELSLLGMPMDDGPHWRVCAGVARFVFSLEVGYCHFEYTNDEFGTVSNSSFYVAATLPFGLWKGFSVRPIGN